MDHESFWLICTEDNQTKCHCDWRITIVDCIERQPMLYIYIVNTILSFLCIVLGVSVLFHRTINKRLPIFDRHSFLIRPKPIEALVFFGVIFNALRIFNTMLLITDSIPNTIVRSFLYELPWQFGICAFSCYLFGVAHTVSNSSKIFEKQWYLSMKIDLACYAMIILPFITNNICSIASAVYANRNDMKRAKGFTDALYFLWTIYCFTFAVLIFVAGLKLTSLLKLHLDNQKDEDPDSLIVQKVKNGLMKARVIMSISIGSLLIFTIVKICYGIARVPILSDTGTNLTIAVIWTFDGTLASLILFSTVIFNPKFLASFGPSISTTSSFFFGIKSSAPTMVELEKMQPKVRLSEDTTYRNSLTQSNISKHHLVPAIIK